MMFSIFALLLVSRIPLSLATSSAPQISRSPGNSYIATIDPTENVHNTSGTLLVSSSTTSPATIELTLSNLPSSGGPFSYHIHTHAVPKDPATGLLNCTAALAHLDPYDRGETPACDPAAPQSCQLGDLAGKHGAVPADHRTFVARYIDAFISTSPADADAYIGGARSLVVHFANKTRIACANLIVLPDAIQAPLQPQHGRPGCNKTATLPAAMVTAPGTAPVIPRQSTVKLSVLPAMTTGGPSRANATTTPALYKGAAARVTGQHVGWLAGGLGAGIAVVLAL